MPQERKENHQILVVDDDPKIVDVITRLLELEGYLVYGAEDGIQALEVLKQQDIHLILLDIMMPKLNGISTLLKVREQHNIPVIILSAKTEESDKVAALTMGADDYIEKPFQTAEMIARVKSQLRRYFQLGASRQLDSEQDDNVMKNGNLELDLQTKEIRVMGQAYSLTATEFKIMELLMRYPGRVFSAEQIYEAVWNDQAYAVENTVMIHIRRIREKIEVNPKKSEYLKVVWGIGYKIEKC